MDSEYLDVTWNVFLHKLKRDRALRIGQNRIHDESQILWIEWQKTPEGKFTNIMNYQPETPVDENALATCVAIQLNEHGKHKLIYALQWGKSINLIDQAHGQHV